jgi:AraC-like DNA-binding protein
VSQSSSFVEPTTLAGYTEAITRALEAAGVDPEAVLREAHVQRVRSNDPMLRITDSDINAIYERAVAATGDACFGLRVSDYIVPGMLHALGYALLASETLEDFCNRLVRYWALVAQSADFSVAADGGVLRLEAVARNAGLCFETEDTFAALVLRLMRMAYQGNLFPLQVGLRRPLPAGGDAPYREVFGCPLVFGQHSLSLCFDLATMREPLSGASRELAQHNDQIVMRYLEKLDRDDIVNRVRAHIVAGLSGGSFSRPDIAASVHMSASTLQGKLARAGVTFQQLLDETRRELALAYIEQSRLSITEIAFMLGFSDLSNFIRAFKRWTGKSPTEFRGRSH